jgi:hypothetical protein
MWRLTPIILHVRFVHHCSGSLSRLEPKPESPWPVCVFVCGDIGQAQAQLGSTRVTEFQRPRQAATMVDAFSKITD